MSRMRSGGNNWKKGHKSQGSSTWKEWDLEADSWTRTWKAVGARARACVSLCHFQQAPVPINPTREIGLAACGVHVCSVLLVFLCAPIKTLVSFLLVCVTSRICVCTYWHLWNTCLVLLSAGHTKGSNKRNPLDLRDL